MNEELDYAEMLEIPVQTVTVKKREKKHGREEGLEEQLVEQVNEKMEEEDPAFAESKPIEREIKPRKKRSRASKLLLAEFIAVCALCAAIFLTNILLPNSAINTFVRGLFNGETAQTDTRTYLDFTLSPVVNEYVEADIQTSSAGVLSFTQKCSVYSPCDGTLVSVNGNEVDGYTLQVQHSNSFSTIMSGLDSVYLAQGDRVRANLPLAYSNGEGEVRVMFYDGETLIDNLTVNGNDISWS